jgi:phosphatidylinositol alpha-1,6-mannosyltransferase
LEKVVLLTHEFPPFAGGVATYCEELALACCRLGIPVEVWTLGSPEEHTSPWPFPVRRFGGRTSLRIKDLVRLAAGVTSGMRKEGRGALWLVASYGAQQAWLFLSGLGLTSGRPWVPVFHGSELLRYRRYPWLRGRFSQTPPPVRVGVVSQFVGNLFRGLYPELFDRTECVLAPGAPRERMRELLAVQKPPPQEGSPLSVLTLARLHPRKGQLEVARALACLPKSLREQVRYMVGGKGDKGYLAYLQGFCRQQGITLEYLGRVPEEELSAVYLACDIFAMASRQLPTSVEGLGLAYLEAALYGKPAVGYCSGGVPEAVIHKKTGLLVPEGDFRALGHAIEELLSSPELRGKLGRQAKAHALGFRWETTAKALLFGREIHA